MSKAYVINLDKSEDRWERIQKDWNNTFELERVSAVEASPGWHGCFLSHIKILEQAKARGDPYVLVWEDDCIPKIGRHKNVVKELWDEILPNLIKYIDKWDILIGGSSTTYGAEPIFDSDLSTKNVNVFRLPNGATTHWTFYNASIYDKIIDWKNGIKERQIDQYMFDIARVFTTAPFMAEQAPCYSFLRKEVTDYSDLFYETEKLLLSKQE
jgi:hypothetical protein